MINIIKIIFNFYYNYMSYINKNICYILSIFILLILIYLLFNSSNVDEHFDVEIDVPEDVMSRITKGDIPAIVPDNSIIFYEDQKPNYFNIPYQPVNPMKSYDENPVDKNGKQNKPQILKLIHTENCDKTNTFDACNIVKWGNRCARPHDAFYRFRCVSKPIDPENVPVDITKKNFSDLSPEFGPVTFNNYQKPTLRFAPFDKNPCGKYHLEIFRKREIPIDDGEYRLITKIDRSKLDKGIFVDLDYDSDCV